MKIFSPLSTRIAAAVLKQRETNEEEIGIKANGRPLRKSIAALIGLALSSGFAVAAPLNVELILDASGSMNGKLPSGERKIAGAKSAVEAFIGKINPEINLSFRAYGHQFHRTKKNCKDTQLIVPFDKASKNASTVVSSAKPLKAQGYTPISYVLGLAADDLKPTEGKHTIVLVSDGKETCKGDPCLLAKKLAAADVDLVIHTIGFGVDATTKRQLQCIAKMARGEYFSANDIAELSASMTTAVEKAEVEPVKETETVDLSNLAPGRLEIRGAKSHDVFNAETGKEVTNISYTKTIETVPAGIYNVKFDNGLWKSVEVKPNETTVLKPAILEIKNGYNHDIIDQETGQSVASVSKVSTGGKAVLVPGRFDVQFEDTFWRDVILEEGKTTILNAGGVDIKGAGVNGVRIYDINGKQVAKVRSTRSYAPLPPGKYVLQLKDGQKIPLDITAGKVIAIKLK